MFPEQPWKETRFPLPLLPTVVVPIQTKKGDLHLRALLDTGSMASFIMVSASLRIPSVIIESDIPLTVCTVQGMSREPSTKLRVNLKTEEGGLPFECLKVPRIMQIGQGAEFDVPMRWQLENIPLNEPLSERGGKIDLLLVIPVFWKIVMRACLIHLFCSIPYMEMFYAGRPQAWGKRLWRVPRLLKN